MTWLALFAIFLITAESALSVRFPALLRSFRYQSLLLAILTFLAAIKSGSLELYFVSILIVFLKAFLIPTLFQKLIVKIKAGEHLGLFINSQLSLIVTIILGFIAWNFSQNIIPSSERLDQLAMSIALFMMLVGIWLMVSRIKAMAQVIGLLMMENGVFLAATIIPGGTPFFIEIAIFFDILVSAMIFGLFIYRINAIFTHIDVSKLTGLKG